MQGLNPSPAAARWLGRGVIIVLASGAILMIAVPLLALIWRGLRGQAWTLLSGAQVPQAVMLSLVTTSTSLLIILILGTPLAYILARWDFRGRRWLNVLIEIPIVLPPAVAGLGLLVAFGRRGLLGPALETVGIRVAFTRLAVILAQTFVALPFYTRAAQAGFHMVDREAEDAALVDGATRWWAFVYVTVPLASRSLLNGALLSWARALGEFGATIIVAGNLPGRTQTMPLLVYGMLERNINAAIWTALILVGLAILATAGTRLLAQRD
jgi:molybdate transport system permease protein